MSVVFVGLLHEPVLESRLEAGVDVPVVELTVEDHEDALLVLLLGNLLDDLRGRPRLVLEVELCRGLAHI